MLKKIIARAGKFFLILVMLVSCISSVPSTVYAGTGGTFYPSRTGHYFFTLDGSKYRVDLSIGTTQKNTHYKVSQSMTCISGSGGATIDSSTWTFSDMSASSMPDIYSPGDREYRLYSVIHFSKPGYHVSEVTGNGVQSSVDSYTDSSVKLRISTNDCGITNYYDGTGNFYHNTLGLELSPNTYTMTSKHQKHYNGEWTTYKTTTATAKYGSVYTSPYLTPPKGYYAHKRDSNNGWTVKGDHSFNVYYSPYSYTETFNSNGGTISGSAKWSTSVTYDSTNSYEVCKKTKETTRTGYTFAGWYTSASGGKQIYDASGYCTNDGKYWSGNRWHYTGDLTLYAHWTPNKYTLFYEANSGSCSTASKAVTYEKKIGSMATPTKTHYSFLGWFTSASGGSQWSDSTKYSTAGNSTVYAHWALAECVTTYDSQGGSAIPARTDSIYTQYSNLQTPSRPGWDFQGWYTKPNGGGTLVQNGTEVPDIEYTTIYAKWSVHVSTVSLTGTVNQSKVLYSKGNPIILVKLTGKDVAGNPQTYLRSLQWSAGVSSSQTSNLLVNSGKYTVTILGQNEYSQPSQQSVDTSQGNNSSISVSRDEVDYSKYTGNSTLVQNLK